VTVNEIVVGVGERLAVVVYVRVPALVETVIVTVYVPETVEATVTLPPVIWLLNALLFTVTDAERTLT
jgi:hypothetical protein